MCIPISIQLPAIDQSCIYTYINTIASYRPVLYVYYIDAIASYRPVLYLYHIDTIASYIPVLYVYHIDTISSYRPVLYLNLHQYNCKLQTSLVFIPISIQLPAIDQSCIYTYINAIASYTPVLYVFLY